MNKINYPRGREAAAAAATRVAFNIAMKAVIYSLAAYPSTPHVPRQARITLIDISDILCETGYSLRLTRWSAVLYVPFPDDDDENDPAIYHQRNMTTRSSLTTRPLEIMIA